MNSDGAAASIVNSVLIVDGDIVSRHAISAYLRHCGYDVVEAASTDEAMVALNEPTLSLDVIVCDVGAIGEHSVTELAAWAKEHRPELEVRMAGSLDCVAATAAELCESGPHLTRPYEPEAVVAYVTRLRAAVADAGLQR